MGVCWKKGKLEFERAKIEGEFVKKLRRRLGKEYHIRVEKDYQGTHIFFDEKRRPLQFPTASRGESE